MALHATASTPTPPADRILRPRELAERIGLSLTTLWRLRRRGDLPEPLRLSPGLFIEPGSPWENGYVESFNGKLRDELLDREIFYTLTEAQILIERWRRQYNTVRPHSALGYRPPAPDAIMPVALGSLEMSPALS